MSRDRDRDRNTKPPGTPDDDERDLATQVLAALRSMGWIIPRTAEQVASAQRELAAGGGALPAPPPLRPDRAGGHPPIQPSAGQAQAGDIDAALARAAREAGCLTPEIERRMLRDRQAAEQQADAQADPEAHDGPDVR